MAFESFVKEIAEKTVIILKDQQTNCEVEIYAFGGLLNAFRLPVNKQLFNIVHGFDSVDDAMANITNGFRSAKLSPFVCRMYKGKYFLDHTAYTIEKHLLSGHAIHGLLYDAVFEVKETVADSAKASVTLVYAYNGSLAGYPFPYTMEICWQLEAANKLTVTTAITNQSAGAIPLADGWHPYFRLGGYVDEWHLQFDGRQQFEFDAELIPTGNKTEDPRFTGGASLKGIQLDNSYELLRTTPLPRCILQNEQLLLVIEPDKSYPVLQVYIPPHRTSIAIENLSGIPDNFNNHLGLIMLPPGETRQFVTSYQVTSK